jgi:hypothetical protein
MYLFSDILGERLNFVSGKIDSSRSDFLIDRLNPNPCKKLANHREDAVNAEMLDHLFLELDI